ncbi:MAG: hypothetical protein JSS27_11405 [Planctomycetes bacterium]|nr:hypothetical protein [Planctomycetota bacterium]
MATVTHHDSTPHADYNPFGKHGYWRDHFDRSQRHRMMTDDLFAGRVVVAILTAVLAVGFVLMAFSVAACM